MSLHIEFENYRLANGLNVILHCDQRVPIVSVNIWYHVGSRNERPGKTGFAHLFEHMMFQGSAHIPADKHFQYIQSIGGTLNGSTFFDRTNYFETVPAHYLETALWLESDRMGYFLPALTQQKLDTQLDVVKNERRQRYENQPYGLWLETLLEMCFEADFPYHWPVIGYMEDLNSATLEDVSDFFKSWYTPANASLVIAGDFDPADTRALVEKYFGPIASAGKPAAIIPQFVDFNRGEQRRVLYDKVQLPRLYIAYHLPPFGTDAAYSADLISDVLSLGKRGRLYQSLVYEQQIAQEAQALVLPMQNASLMIFVATPKPGVNVEQVEAALQKEIDAIGNTMVQTRDYERIMNQLEARKLRELQSVSARADHLNMFHTYFEDANLINTEIDRYKSITTRQIREVAAAYLQNNNRSVLTYLPDSQETAA